jgi:hypothetical protein
MAAVSPAVRYITGKHKVASTLFDNVNSPYNRGMINTACPQHV